MKKPSRYSHDKQDWNDRDIFFDCKETMEKCPLGYPGHRTYWLKTPYNTKCEVVGSEIHTFFEVVIRINHAHFVRNRDTGRHVDDVIGTTWIDEKYTVVTRRLDYAHLPDWIREENDK